MYANGQSVPKDFTQAVYWYKKAAEQGLPDAQYKLADLYLNGRGVPKDYTQALHLYKKSS